MAEGVKLGIRPCGYGLTYMREGLGHRICEQMSCWLWALSRRPVKPSGGSSLRLRVWTSESRRIEPG